MNNLLNARLYFVPNRARSARKASIEAHADRLRNNLEQWQRELTDKGKDPELTTVAVVLADGELYAHIGPWDYYRKAQLKRAGVNVPKPAEI